MEDLNLVNTFSRIETMKEKTRELTKNLCAFVERKDFDKFLELQDQFDHLATDWIYGSELEWDGSIVDKQFQQAMNTLKAANA